MLEGEVFSFQMEGRLAEYLKDLKCERAKDVLWKELSFGGLIFVNWITRPGQLSYIIRIEYYPYGIERSSASIPIRGVVLETIEIWPSRGHEEERYHDYISRIIRNNAQHEVDMQKPVLRSALVLFYSLKSQHKDVARLITEIFITTTKCGWTRNFLILKGNDDRKYPGCKTKK